MTRPKAYLRALAFLCLLASAAPTSADQTQHTHDASNNTVMIMAPWVRAAPPTARVMAGYVTLHNQSDGQRSLTGVSSPMFERIEIHESYVEDGVSKMRQLIKLDIAPGKMVTLKPGGLHLMLIGPTAAAKRASQIDMTFAFEDGSTKTLKVNVLDRGDAMPTMQHQSH